MFGFGIYVFFAGQGHVKIDFKKLQFFFLNPNRGNLNISGKIGQ